MFELESECEVRGTLEGCIGSDRNEIEVDEEVRNEIQARFQDANADLGGILPDVRVTS